jgi:hypothetical protein
LGVAHARSSTECGERHAGGTSCGVGPRPTSVPTSDSTPSGRCLLRLPRATLCQQFCRTDRLVRLWIELFNRGGIDALIIKARPGRRRKVKLKRVGDLLVPVLENPTAVGPRPLDRCKTPRLFQGKTPTGVRQTNRFHLLHPGMIFGNQSDTIIRIQFAAPLLKSEFQNRMGSAPGGTEESRSSRDKKFAERDHRSANQPLRTSPAQN